MVLEATDFVVSLWVCFGVVAPGSGEGNRNTQQDTQKGTLKSLWACLMGAVSAHGGTWRVGVEALDGKGSLWGAGPSLQASLRGRDSTPG